MFEIKNLKNLAKIVLKAVKNKEKIILYGDSDLDGVGSVIIFKETLQNLGFRDIKVYFPDREKEGYGISKKALNYLRKFSPALFVALDCGISNFKEAEIAKKLKFNLAIIDHHEVLDRLPQAKIIVNPKQKNDPYPFKGLATTGIVYKVSKAILGKKFSKNLKNSFLELVALATIADMMPEKDENIAFIENGLESLKNTWRPGLKAFFEMKAIKKCRSIREIAQIIISSLNTATVKDHLNEAYLILTSPDVENAKILAKDLFEKSRERRITIRKIIEEIKEKYPERTDERIIFEGSSYWPFSLTGAIASRICNFFKKPTFIYKKFRRESRGSVRMPFGLNGVEAMKKCSSLLETYGGHPVACGFTVRNKNLEKFKKCLLANYK
jgi:single-stranded-DNA-specific exonuclease